MAAHGPGPGLISVDVGTSAAKALLYRHGEGIVSEAREPYGEHRPRPGWVEQDADEVLAGVVRALHRLVERAGVAPGTVDALVLDGIWNSFLPLDAAGRPLCRALIWSDQRAAAQSAALGRELDAASVRAATGCSLHPMYGLARLRWLREEAPDTFRAAARFATLKEYLLAELFGARVVDRTTASGTGLWNLHTLDWDAELLAAVGASPGALAPAVEPTSVLRGLTPRVAAATGLAAGTPGVAGLADGAAAHLGAVGWNPGRLSLSVGTSAALRVRTDAPRVDMGSESWCYYLAEGSWLAGGVLHGAGNALRWLADRLLSGEPAATPEALDRAVEALVRAAERAPVGAGGLLFLPFLAGERCPVNRPEARGTLHGLALDHGREHLARALLEGIGYGMFAIYRMLVGTAPVEPVVTGGILRSPPWLAMVSALFGRRLWLPGVPESAAFGGVVLALRALGACGSLQEASRCVVDAGTVEPDPRRSREYTRVVAAYDRLHAGTLALPGDLRPEEAP